MRITEVGFDALISLEPHGADTYVGSAPTYPSGRLFGGQVVAQALRAAQHTVPDNGGGDSHEIHSLHAYFIKGGTHDEPVRYDVDRIRNGRSFTTRRVVARQSAGAILSLSASFQVAEDEADVQSMAIPTDLAPPDESADIGWGGLLRRRLAASEPGRTLTWVKLDGEGGLDPRHDECSLAFVSDAVPSAAVRTAHPIQVPRKDMSKTFVGASLDHVVYFLRPGHAHRWLLADVRCHGLVGGRGVAVGNLFDPDGLHVLTIVQEVLLRERRARPVEDIDRPLR